MKKLRTAMLFLATFSLYGCFDAKEDVHTFVAKVKKTAPGKIKELPTEKPMVKQDFTAKDLRSPFVAARRSDKIGNISQIDGEEGATEEIVQAPRPDANRRREFLEQFPLSEFTMVGSISKGNYIWGLIKNSDGLVFPVKVGDYIGQDSGYIVAINENKISIEETVPNGRGGWKREMTALDIQDASDNQAQVSKQKTTKTKQPSKTNAVNQPQGATK